MNTTGIVLISVIVTALVFALLVTLVLLPATMQWPFSIRETKKKTKHECPQPDNFEEQPVPDMTRESRQKLLLSESLEGFSYIVSYYDNIDGLVRQAQVWATYDPKLAKTLEFVVVDDGSRKDPLRNHVDEIRSIMARSPAKVIFVELEEDIGFNSGGAKNTGVLYTTKRIMFMTDMDTVVPCAYLQFVMRLAHRIGENEAFRNFFASYNIDSEKGALHPNVFLVPKTIMARLGGYHEDFSGNYAVEDLEFAHRLRHHGVQFIGSDLKPFPWVINTQEGITSTNIEKDERTAQIKKNDVVYHRLQTQKFPKPTSTCRVPHHLVAKW